MQVARRGRFTAPTADLSAPVTIPIIAPPPCRGRFTVPTADNGVLHITSAMQADQSIGLPPCHSERSEESVGRQRFFAALRMTRAVRESHPSSYLYESDVAHRWWALSRDVMLPLSDGGACQLHFQGRPGGALGPDVRDAVLLFARHGKPVSMSMLYEEQAVGDIEFHIRSSDWYNHAHHTDPRYNNVILHMVLIYDDATPIQRQDGGIVPTCCLNDLPPAAYAPPIWPCQQVIAHMNDAERARLLNFAGQLRFEQKTRNLLILLREAQPRGTFSAYDTCLIAALAEGLGYGRDRAFFRAAGLHLLDLLSKHDIPEPLGHTDEPSSLDANRLRILGHLVQKWRVYGLWETLRNAVFSACQQEIRVIFEGLSTARTDILICNVVLPFAAAVGLLENDTLLAEKAESLYVRYPALSSNTITRAMCRQLQLSREPQSACQQQGLHYIYAATCREKHCSQCIAGLREWGQL